MNKKISRLLESNLTLYFLLLLAFAAAALYFELWLGVAELVVAVFAYLWLRRDNLRRKRSVMQYIESVAGSMDSARVTDAMEAQPHSPAWEQQHCWHQGGGLAAVSVVLSPKL